MIELANIKATNTVGQLRGLINTMQNEIMSDQPFIGTPVNPSINYYKASIDGNPATLVATNTASTVTNGLTMLCFPENNGVFVASVWGSLAATAYPAYASGHTGETFNYAVVDIPAVKLATRETSVSTFVTCEHLGLPSISAVDAPLKGVVTKPVMGNISFVTFDYNGANNSGMVLPYIEQGDNVCNVIFPYTPIK